MLKGAPLASVCPSAEAKATLQPADVSHKNIPDCRKRKHRSCWATSIQIQVSFWGLILIVRGDTLKLTHREEKKFKKSFLTHVAFWKTKAIFLLFAWIIILFIFHW